MKNNVSERLEFEYRNYIGSKGFDADTGMWYGKVTNTEDFVNYESNNESELENEFHKAVDDYIDFTNQIKLSDILSRHSKLNVWEKCFEIPFIGLRNRFYEWKLKIKSKHQRKKRGWANEDTWSINWWFLNTMLPMLTHFRDNLNGYPICFENETQWQDELTKMIELLKKIKEPDAYENPCHVQMRVRAKDEFFKLFSKYFFDLWD